MIPFDDCVRQIYLIRRQCLGCQIDIMSIQVEFMQQSPLQRYRPLGIRFARI